MRTSTWRNSASWLQNRTFYANPPFIRCTWRRKALSMRNNCTSIYWECPWTVPLRPCWAAYYSRLSWLKNSTSWPTCFQSLCLCSLKNSRRVLQLHQTMKSLSNVRGTPWVWLDFSSSGTRLTRTFSMVSWRLTRVWFHFSAKKCPSGPNSSIWSKYACRFTVVILRNTRRP